VSEVCTIHKFEIYDGDATVTVERTMEKEGEVFTRLMNWYRKNSAVVGEVIFQSDRCQETACELLADLADDVFQFETQWKDD